MNKMFTATPFVQLLLDHTSTHINSPHIHSLYIVVVERFIYVRCECQWISHSIQYTYYIISTYGVVDQRKSPRQHATQSKEHHDNIDLFSDIRDYIPVHIISWRLATL